MNGSSPATNEKGGSGPATLQIKVGGMSCSFCAESIRKAVGRRMGVDEVHVSLAHEEVLVRYHAEQISETAINDTLRGLGYTVRDPRKVQSFEEQEALMRRERNNLIAAAFFAVTLILVMSAMWLDLLAMRASYTWAAWAAATFVFAWLGRHIIAMAWGAARRGITNQHVLLVAGATGGYIGGVLGAPVPFLNWYGLAGFPAVDFFGVVVFLTTYHLLSGYVSLLVRTRASQSVRKLLELQPPTARVMRDGREEEIAIDDVLVGDLVRVRPGERVPVDGVVAEGRSAVDEALVTGEPIPAEKGPGDEVIGGSLNQTGALVIRVNRVGEESFLRQVARHVEEAKALKPGIIVLVDRVLRHYVPIVLAIAAAAFLLWTAGPAIWADGPLWVRAIYAAVTVLVMGYPCALGMATPLALVRGAGMAAERGILMRSGEAFQVLKDIEAIVLDKTGTITRGKPRVVEVVPFHDYRREEVYYYAASAEALSEHPLAQAIVDAARDEGVDVSAAHDFDAVTGAGVEAVVDGRAVLVGRPAFLAERAVEVRRVGRQLAEHEAQGHTAVLVALSGELIGLLAIADALKPDAVETIARMKEIGLVPIMVTGDAERTAQAVAREAGIESVYARVRPDRKAELVREFQRGGRRVAFVGDGINDAPALMQADVGIAMGAGTDIAIESSDVILIGERLSAVLDAYEIGGVSYRKTVQNLWLAFLFNGVGVPLAATGIVHPVWAMIAMAASVTAVLLNSFGGRLLSGSRVARQVAEQEPDAGGRDGRRAAERELEMSPAQVAAGGVVIEVPDMYCRACETRVETLLVSHEGVEAVDADAKNKLVTVTFHPDRVELTQIEEALSSLGFRIRRVHVQGRR